MRGSNRGGAGAGVEAGLAFFGAVGREYPGPYPHGGDGSVKTQATPSQWRSDSSAAGAGQETGMAGASVPAQERYGRAADDDDDCDDDGPEPHSLAPRTPPPVERCRPSPGPVAAPRPRPQARPSRCRRRSTGHSGRHPPSPARILRRGPALSKGLPSAPGWLRSRRASRRVRSRRQCPSPRGLGRPSPR